ncbi:hypothetical protein WT27_12585 [Burkholderia territorii]|uniref:Uncharacterized protein n=1 Tax=Burkholderia territorii TaxID=1503055 RepID=A0A125A9A5_9BURK|nr:hypothetical protein [Burkholderia territorii]KVV40762.1 hypothetical protein WT27_12585 [Burkholderia territorii]
MTHEQDMIATLLEYAMKYAETNDEPEGGDCRQAIALAQRYLRSPTATVAPQQDAVPRFELMHSGANPHRYQAEAIRTGDAGIYEEVRVSVFDCNDTCVADALVGLTEAGELRVLVTTDADGDGDHRIAVYPTRSAAAAVDAHWE